MKSIPFTKEQIQFLEQNPYTASVSKHIIRYTLEFKEFALWESKKGTTSTKIFVKAGYDPEILGKTRIYNALKHFKREAASSEGLKEPVGLTKEQKAEQFASADFSKKRTDTALKELQSEISYLKQQVEFLKKISFLNE